MQLIMKSEFDNLKNNPFHTFASDSNGDKKVIKVFVEGEMIAKKIILKKSVRFFGIKNYQQYLSQ